MRNKPLKKIVFVITVLFVSSFVYIYIYIIESEKVVLMTLWSKKSFVNFV